MIDLTELKPGDVLATAYNVFEIIEITGRYSFGVDLSVEVLEASAPIGFVVGYIGYWPIRDPIFYRLVYSNQQGDGLW